MTFITNFIINSDFHKLVVGGADRYVRKWGIFEIACWRRRLRAFFGGYIMSGGRADHPILQGREFPATGSCGIAFSRALFLQFHAERIIVSANGKIIGC